MTCGFARGSMVQVGDTSEGEDPRVIMQQSATMHISSVTQPSFILAYL